MLRRIVLLLTAVVIVVSVAALARQKPEKQSLLLLDWAVKGMPEVPPVAILIEMGLKDTEPTDWSGKATVTGAKVVHREGYRFRDGDKLVPPDGWLAMSRRPIRAPRGNPAVARQMGFDTVGIVIHLMDLQDEVTLNLDIQGSFTKVPLAKVLHGERVPILDGKGVVRLISTATPIATGKTEDDFPAAAYGSDGTLWVAYVSYHLKDESRRIDQQPLKEQPTNFKDYYKPEFGDQLFVKYYREGKWSEPIAITGANEDLVRCDIAAENEVSIWVAYTANRKGNHDIYARQINVKWEEAEKQRPPLTLEPEVRLTTNPLPDLNPVMVTPHTGSIALAYQSWYERDTPIFLTMGCQGGKWSDDIDLDGRGKLGRNFIGHRVWHPTMAVGPNCRFAALCDEYIHGDYDIDITIHATRRTLFIQGLLLTSSRNECRPSICYDVQGRLWIAYEEGPVQWGKDYGAFDLQDGNPLYNQRSVRVVCFDATEDGKERLLQPVAELPTSSGWEGHPEVGGRLPKYEAALRYAYPKIGLDGKGRVWLTYRQKFGTRYSTHPGSYWLTFARRLDGDKWTEPIEIHRSDGLLDSRPVMLPHINGGLLVIHNTDGRYTTPEKIDNQVYMSVIDLPGDPIEPQLVPHTPGDKDPKLVERAKEELEAVKRIREYRIQVGGKTYRPLRGEFHRHTEMSWDGGPDGSLEDMFRYAIDAAAFDWIGNGDHDNGAGREYSWWLTQKFTDAYHVANAFTPMFTYERSVSYPHGHRNAMFAQRGVRTLPRLAEPDQMKRVAGVHADDTKLFYRYLHELKGICASHTCATGMGTDWRDHDPVVEPVVEIYQGDRMSYEFEGCPRAGFDPKGDKLPAQIGGWRPLGFLNHAFKKGHRLGFQASSDHWSTHISYCIPLAENFDRAGILDALRRRHCYGATDNIVLDVRSGEHLMGDEFQTRDAPSLTIKAIGTQPIAKVDILKDSEVVHTFEPKEKEFTGKWTDPMPTAGTHYYYVRVLQVDDEIAWGSPMWIEFTK